MIKRMGAAIDRASHNRMAVAVFVTAGAVSAAVFGWTQGLEVGRVIFG